MSEKVKRKHQPKESEEVAIGEFDESVAAFPKHQGASVHLAARSLSYFVPDKNKKSKKGCCGKKSSDDDDSAASGKAEKQILRKINFDAKPGELTAILGPSGSGKTTLLDCLAGRMSVGRSEGDILLNGINIAEAKVKLKSLAGYVKQKDLLFSTATVRELITYAALMRLPASQTREEKLQRVEEIIAELGLKRCADTRLGSAADGGGGNVKGGSERGVSGGELKRVAIAIELITQPSLLFLDEPTSGLDASAAFTLLRSLKRLALSGCTIVCTLHQPRSSIWQLFDKVVLMKEGQIVFSGAPQDSISFFAENGWNCPTFTNPADYVLDVISEFKEDGADSTQPDGKSVSKMIRRFRKRQERQIEKDNKERENSQDIYDLIKSTKQAKRNRPGFIEQFRVLLIRAWRNNIRHALILGAQLGQHLFLALFVGLMYLQVGPKSLSTNLITENATIITDRSAALFFALLNITFVSAFTEAFVFPAERPIFNRERASGHYGVLPYYAALTAASMPLQLLFVIINASISYWMIGLRPDFGAFILYIVLCLLCTLVVQGATLVLSALSPSADVANLLMGILILLFMSFAGFFLSIPNIPIFFKPFEYISPYKYAFRALLVNDFNGITFNCTAPVVAQAPQSLMMNFTAPVASNSTAFCPYTDGNAALKILGMQDSSIVADSMILLGMVVIYRILTYVILLFVKVGGD